MHTRAQRRKRHLHRRVDRALAAFTVLFTGKSTLTRLLTPRVQPLAEDQDVHGSNRNVRRTSRSTGSGNSFLNRDIGYHGEAYFHTRTDSRPVSRLSSSVRSSSDNYQEDRDEVYHGCYRRSHGYCSDDGDATIDHDGTFKAKSHSHGVEGDRRPHHFGHHHHHRHHSCDEELTEHSAGLGGVVHAAVAQDQQYAAQMQVRGKYWLRKVHVHDQVLSGNLSTHSYKHEQPPALTCYYAHTGPRPVAPHTGYASWYVQPLSVFHRRGDRDCQNRPIGWGVPKDDRQAASGHSGGVCLYLEGCVLHDRHQREAPGVYVCVWRARVLVRKRCSMGWEAVRVGVWLSWIMAYV